MGLFLPGENRQGIFIDTEVARKLGINTAIVLSRIIWSIEAHMGADDASYFRQGRWWMRDSISSLITYSTLGRKQISLVLKNLRGLGIIHVEQFDKNKGELHNYYAVDGDRLSALMAHTDISIDPQGQIAPHSAVRDVSPPPLCRNGSTHSAVRGVPIDPQGHNLHYIKSPTKSLTKSPGKVIPLTPPKLKRHTFEPGDVIVAEKWLAYARREAKCHYPSWTVENFAKQLAKLRQATDPQLNFDGLLAVLSFIENDSFWCQVCCSPAGMLHISKSNGRRKIDNVLSRMKPDSLRQEEKIRSWADSPDEPCPFIFEV